MSISSLALGVALGYASMGSLFVAVIIYAETLGQSNRPWYVGLRQLLPLLPLLALICLVLWPLILLAAWVEVRREHALFRVTSGLPPVPSRALTETDWLQGKDAVLLLSGLGRRVSARKRHLIAAACCRRIWSRIADPRSRQAVELAERHAEGRATSLELQTACNEARRASGEATQSQHVPSAAAARACLDASLADAAGAAYRALFVASSRSTEARVQCALVRDVLGNPFRPLPPRAFPGHVRALAALIEQGDEELLPVLADALAELGEEECAAHLRQGGHVKGCHILDWVLGKSDASAGLP